MPVLPEIPGDVDPLIPIGGIPMAFSMNRPIDMGYKAPIDIEINGELENPCGENTSKVQLIQNNAQYFVINEMELNAS